MGGLLVILLLAPRPALSGPELTAGSVEGAYKVHYTLTGADALFHGATDENPANGIPDDVDAALQGASTVYEKYVTEGGMNAPLGDGTDGGDDRIDIYLRMLDGARGYAHPQASGLGPATSAWLEVDPVDAAVETIRLAAATGHECFHSIEFAESAALEPWWNEASAAYVEHSAFTSATLQAETDAHYAAILDAPDVPLDTVDGSHEYDELVFVAYLLSGTAGVSQFFGTATVDLPSLWSAATTAGGVVNALSSLHSPIESLLLGYVEWLHGSCSPPVAGAPPPACSQSHALHLTGIGAIPSSTAINLPSLSLGAVAVPVAQYLDAGDDVYFKLSDTAAIAWSFSDGAASSFGDMGAARLDESSTLLYLAAGQRTHADLTVNLSLVPGASDGGDASNAGDGGAITVDASGCSCGLGARQVPGFPVAAALLFFRLVLFRVARRGGRARP